MTSKRKLDLFGKVIPAIDAKDYELYDQLSEVERKSFGAPVIMRWGANVDINDNEALHYYLASTNHHANKHLFSLSKHPKLQWLMIVASSPKFGHFKRKWIGKKKTPVTESKKFILSRLREMYPTYKDDEIELLSTIVTKRELTQYAKDCGEK